jgi:hypothetical protein
MGDLQANNIDEPLQYYSRFKRASLAVGGKVGIDQ